MEAQDLGIFLVRLAPGLFFTAHGCQLLFGWFGGGGLGRTRQSFYAMGFRPAGPFALAAASTELGCGAAVVLGFLWPLPAILLAGPMTVAVVRVHWPKIWVTESGIEYPFVLGTIMAGAGLIAPGRLSADHLLGIGLPLAPFYLGGLLAAELAAVAALASAWPWVLPQKQGAPPAKAGQ